MARRDDLCALVAGITGVAARGTGHGALEGTERVGATEADFTASGSDTVTGWIEFGTAEAIGLDWPIPLINHRPGPQTRRVEQNPIVRWFWP